MFEVLVQSGIPVVLVGPNGIGKTATIGALAEFLNLRLIKLPLLGVEPVDFIGYPYIEGGKMKFAEPEFISRLREPNTMLLLDEVNRVPPDKVQALLCQLVDRERGIFAIPNSTYIVGTCNQEDLGTHAMSRMLRTRMAWVPMTPNIQGYLKYLSEGAFSNNFIKLPPNWEENIGWARNLMWIFLQSRPSVLLEPAQDEQFAYATLRGCDYTIRGWAAMAALGRKSLSDLLYVSTACCGQAFSAELSSFLRSMELPRVEEFIEEYLNEGLRYPFNDRRREGSLVFVLFNEVFSYIETLPEEVGKDIWKRAVDYLNDYLKEGRYQEYILCLLKTAARSKHRGLFPPEVFQLLQQVT